MIFVLDLDDTLYDERTYVLSGFRAVSEYLEKKHSIDPSKSLRFILKELEKNGRGKIFDSILKEHSLFSKKNIRKLISVYRLHKPEIKLYNDSIRFFERFKDVPKYVVTDGNKIVQKRKYDSLNLDRYIKKAFFTYRYGIRNAKPNTYCFHKILKLEKVKPENIICIGDNPNKDFINLNIEGFHTIRIMKGMFKDVKVRKINDGKYKIKSLNEVTPKFIKSIKLN